MWQQQNEDQGDEEEEEDDADRGDDADEEEDAEEGAEDGGEDAEDAAPASGAPTAHCKVAVRFSPVLTVGTALVYPQNYPFAQRAHLNGSPNNAYLAAEPGPQAGRSFGGGGRGGNFGGLGGTDVPLPQVLGSSRVLPVAMVQGPHCLPHRWLYHCTHTWGDSRSGPPASVYLLHRRGAEGVALRCSGAVRAAGGANLKAAGGRRPAAVASDEAAHFGSLQPATAAAALLLQGRPLAYRRMPGRSRASRPAVLGR